MPDLRCTVQTCTHNQNYYCNLDSIVVGGNSAKKAAETSCDSFEETWKNETCRTLTIATGKLAYSTLAGFAEEIMKAFPYIKINVFAIRNDFFGETVTVSGLITGQDLKAQLLEKKASGTDLGDMTARDILSVILFD